MKNSNKLVVIILNHNNTDETIKLYYQLLNQSFSDFIYLVVDDHSNDIYKFKEHINDKFKVFNFPGKFKFGLVKKYNFSFEKALGLNAKYIYLLQSDMDVSKCNNLLERLVNHLDNNKNCWAVGPTIYNQNGIKSWGIEDNKKIIKKRMGHDLWVSESFLMRAEFFSKHGFWVSSFVYYGEEMDYFLRLRKNNYDVDILDDVFLTHFGGGVTHKFQKEKHYYRLRTTIMVLRLHNKKDSFIKKIKYFFDEIYEQKSKFVYFIKKAYFLSLIKLLLIVLFGIIRGLTIKIK